MRAAHLAPALCLVAPLAVVASCGVDELDLTGKACPCVSSYVCDVVTSTCVLGTTRVEGGTATDAAIEPERNPRALLSVSALKPAWSTPNSIRWEWVLEGKAAEFQAVTVSFASKSDDLAKGLGQVLTSRERPELGRFDARGGKTEGPVTLWTPTDVTAGATQFAQVKVTDKNGQSNVSATATAISETQFASSKTLFGGDMVGMPMPNGVFNYRAAFMDYSLVVSCAPSPSPCPTRAELVGLPTNLAPFAQADFNRAYLEVIVEGNVAATVFDSLIAIEPGAGSCTGPECRYGYVGWTQSTAANAPSDRILVPLAKLVNGNGAALTFGVLQQKSFDVSALGISGLWKDGAVIRLKSAKIRW